MMKNINTNKTKQSSRSRSAKAHQILKDRISSGALAPGTALVEFELCEQLDMSRTPIREALNRLQIEGLVEHYPSRGCVVATITKEKVKQTYEAIEAVESMLFYLLAEDHSHPLFPTVELALLEMERTSTIGDWDNWVLADEQYHENLLKCCKNTYITEQCDLLGRPAHQFRMLITKTYIDKTVSTRDHRASYDAVVRGDASAARESAQRHYSWLRAQVIEFWDKFSLY